ncbi:hypothetical protein BH09MYX1_BH09MYX1_19870 [soil metagenome]
MIPAHQVQSSGSMTRMMRAVAHRDLATARVLRVGVVRSGRVIEERIIKQRVAVTIGASEKATFVVPGAIQTQVLFELREGEYRLRFTEGMTGRVALASGIYDLAALRGQAQRTEEGHSLPLSIDARGKIVVSDTTFLFQLVVPPPPETRPQLPLAVRPGLAGSIDWTLTVLAAFSFMFHFGFIGAMYSDWLDAPIDDASVAGILDLTKNLPPAPTPDDVVDTTPSSTAPSPVAPKNAQSAPTAHSSQNGTRAASDRTAEALKNESDAMAMGLILSLKGPSALKQALDRDVPVTDLSVAAQSDRGATTGAVKTSESGPPIGSRDRSLQDLGKMDIDSVATTTARAVDGPRVFGEAQPGPINMSMPVANAEATIASLRPSFRSCYQQKGLSANPAMAGRLVIRIDIAPNGDVKSVTKTGGSGLSPAVEQCIMDRVQAKSFDAPGGGGSKIDVPVTFVNTTK